MLDKIRKNKIIQILLIPFSWLYCIVIIIRNYFYDLGLFKVQQFPVPVISIGNIMAGGAGKTPVTMFLMEKLSERFKSIAIISRGYGRSSSGPIIVSDGTGHIKSAEIGGDEPVMMAQKFTALPVIVAERRAAGIKLALEQFNPDLILLDDAFQHRSVYRDVDILLIDINKNPGRERLIPAGDRREQLKAASRADVIIYTKNMDKSVIKDPFHINKWFSGDSYVSRFVPAGFRNLETGEYLPMHDLAGTSAIAFSGIASPQYFEQNLRDNQIQLCEFINYPDHHRYDQNDHHIIKAAATKHNCTNIITTEKDAVKIKSEYFTGLTILVLEMSIRIDEAEKLVQKINHLIDMKMKSG
jgi:tetraacyldisaccharide 4'-kinase